MLFFCMLCFVCASQFDSSTFQFSLVFELYDMCSTENYSSKPWQNSGLQYKYIDTILFTSSPLYGLYSERKTTENYN